jgi:Protein of unknown function (DUF2568)
MQARRSRGSGAAHSRARATTRGPRRSLSMARVAAAIARPSSTSLPVSAMFTAWKSDAVVDALLLAVTCRLIATSRPTWTNDTAAAVNPAPKSTTWQDQVGRRTERDHQARETEPRQHPLRYVCKSSRAASRSRFPDNEEKASTNQGGNSVKAANDAIRFLVEIAALVAVSYWGFHDHSSWTGKLILGIGAPVLVAATWAIWMAPQSGRRAPEGMRAVIEIVIFGLATAALAASTGAVLAIVFAAVAGVNTVLDHALARHE